MVNPADVMATEDVSIKSNVSLKRPEKLTKVRWITRELPYNDKGFPLLHDVISIHEINRSYSISEVIDAISDCEPEAPFNIVDDTTVHDWNKTDKTFRQILSELSDCRNPKFIEKSRSDLFYRNTARTRMEYNLIMMFQYGVDPEFIALYINSFLLRGVDVNFDSVFFDESKKEFTLKQYFKDHDVKGLGAKGESHLILPKLAFKKPIVLSDIPYLRKNPNSLKGITTVYTPSIVSTIGKSVAAILFGKSDVPESNIHPGGDIYVTHNNYIHNEASVIINSANTMQQTNGDSVLMLNHSGDELPKNAKDLVNIGYRSTLKYVAGLAGCALVIAVLNGHSKFHEMKMTDDTPDIVQVLHSVNEAVYKRIRYSEPAIEISTTGEIKGTIKLEPKSEPELKSAPKSEPKVDNSTVVLDRGTQIQKDFYQAIARFDANNPDSVKQLEVLVVSVNTILVAQKTLGYSDLIVPEDILQNAKQKLADVHNVDEANMLVAQ